MTPPVQPPVVPPPAQETNVATYKLQHSVNVDVPEGAKEVEIWFWLPMETTGQRVLDLDLVKKVPGTKVVTDAYGNRYLVASIKDPTEKQYEIGTAYTVQRSELQYDLTEHAGLSDEQKLLMAPELNYSPSSGFHISQDVLAKCDDVIGKDLAMGKTTREVFDWMLDNTVHYGNPNASGISSSVSFGSGGNGYTTNAQAGSAEFCLPQGGGGCTDQNSLMIAWLRYRGIPAAIEFGAKLPKEEGKSVHPSYRCYAKYFIPGTGWVPMDVSEAGNASSKEGLSDEQRKSKQDYYFAGLDNRRITYYSGRGLPLTRANGELTQPVNLFIHAYVLVDGVPSDQFKVSWEYETLEK